MHRGEQVPLGCVSFIVIPLAIGLGVFGLMMLVSVLGVVWDLIHPAWQYHN